MELVEKETMDGMLGCTMVSWGRDDDGLHITLDDGRVLIFIGILAIYRPAEAVH